MMDDKKQDVPVVALFVNGRIRPSKVVPEKRKDMSPKGNMALRLLLLRIPKVISPKKLHPEVVVVGKDYAGMTARLSQAAEAGGRGYIIEKMPTFQGPTGVIMAISAAVYKRN